MKGIYYIKCTVNKKVYIGSSIKIEQRIKRHIWGLKNNKHPNIHFQNIYNKYGHNSLKFGIIELCEEEEMSSKEQFYIDYNNNLINIVTVDVTRITYNKDIAKKISKILTEKFKNGEINRFNSGSFKKGSKPWNKGKKYKSTDHLKVPKTISIEWIKARKKIIENNRNNAFPKVSVFLKDKFLCIYRCSQDLYEDSLTNNFKLKQYMKLRNPKGRNGLSPYVLQTININKSAKTNKEYKGLLFKNLLP